MAARDPEDGLRKTSNENAGTKDNESESPPAKDGGQRRWNVENHWGFSLEGIFGLALKFFKGIIQFKVNRKHFLCLVNCVTNKSF